MNWFISHGYHLGIVVDAELKTGSLDNFLSFYENHS